MTHACLNAASWRVDASGLSVTYPALPFMQTKAFSNAAFSGYRIRRARATDQADLLALLNDTYRSTWLPQLTPEAAAAFTSEDRLARYVAASWESFWVAARDQDVNGMVHWQDDFIEALHVSRTCQRMGIGAMLLDFAETQMAAAGVTLFRLETDTFNQQSLDFYRHRGYREVGRYPDTEWSSGFTTVLMHKKHPLKA